MFLVWVCPLVRLTGHLAYVGVAFPIGHLNHAFAIPWLCGKPKQQKPEKKPKTENITEEIREKEAEKIALSP